MEGLGDILSHLSGIADRHGMTLEDIARHNLDRAGGRCWSQGPAVLPDRDAPPEEQLPRRMDMIRRENRQGQAVTTINGQSFGNPLRDNNYQDDGYRFHDIFHLSHAAVLGWSPTLRGLLGRRRRSAPRLARVEDGSRAIAIDEGIAALVFSYARERNFLDGAGGLDLGLLRTIREMTAHLEVGCRTEGEWEGNVGEFTQICAEFRQDSEMRRTIRNKLVHDPETAQAIGQASSARRQAFNLAVEHCLAHPNAPYNQVQALLTKRRKSEPERWAHSRVAIQRPGLLQGYNAVRAFHKPTRQCSRNASERSGTGRRPPAQPERPGRPGTATGRKELPTTNSCS